MVVIVLVAGASMTTSERRPQLLIRTRPDQEHGSIYGVKGRLQVELTHDTT
jgi:hypothetical protein